MKMIEVPDLHAAAVEAVGLDGDAVDLASVEAIACSLRRAASFLCPCPANTLLYAVLECTRHLVGDTQEFRVSVEDTLEALVAHGDLFELASTDQDELAPNAVLLYLAAPAYIVRESGALVLLGVIADNYSLLPEEIESQLQCVNHSRMLPPGSDEKYREDLQGAGYLEISSSIWFRMPSQTTASEHVDRMYKLLAESDPAGELPGLLVIDPQRDVRFYPHRWVEPKGLSGVFVGRRSQAYGANVWCLVGLEDGTPVRALDLPLKKSRWRGCDEAWRVQAAIDHNRGAPQSFRIREGTNGTCLVDLFSPVPMWVSRRLGAVGDPTQASGCLFSYKLNEEEIPEEIRFLEEHAWLKRE